jgi:hypothetical protein
MEAMDDKNPLEWPDVAQRQNSRWPPVAILDFQKAVIFEPFELGC